MALQMAMFAPKSEWVPPAELPNIFDAKQIAIDVETRDPHIKSKGPGWPTGDGEVVGYAIAVDGWAGYIPIRHQHGVNDPSINGKSHLPDPARVVLCVVHNFVGRALKYFLEPFVDDALIKVTAAKVAGGNVA